MAGDAIAEAVTGGIYGPTELNLRANPREGPSWKIIGRLIRELS